MSDSRQPTQAEILSTLATGRIITVLEVLDLKLRIIIDNFNHVLKFHCNELEKPRVQTLIDGLKKAQELLTRVTEGDLKIWYEIYQQIYPGFLLRLEKPDDSAFPTALNQLTQTHATISQIRRRELSPFAQAA